MPYKMRTNRYLFILGVSLLLSFGVFCRTYAQNDEALKEAVRKISDIFRRSENYTVHFTVSVENELPPTRGTITVNGVKYNVILPENHIIFDGQDLYNYSKADKEVIIEKGRTDDTPTESLSDIFSLNVDAYTIRKADMNATGPTGANMTAIELVPSDQSEITKLHIFIQKDNPVPAAIHIFPNGGKEIDIDINKVLLDLQPEPERFVFSREKFKNAEIIDFR